MKPLLREFVNSFELAHFQRSPVGLPFESPIPPQSLAWAEKALEFALSTRCAVTLYSRNFSAQAVVAGLVLNRAGVTIDKVYSGELEDTAFARITSTLGAMSKAKMEFVQGWPTPSQTRRGQYQFIC